VNNTKSILSAERSFKKNIENYFLRIWGNTFMPSHDLDHHRRVWFYARELLASANSMLPETAVVDPEKLLIACYMHDIGMSAYRGVRHGKAGSEICKAFLTGNRLKIADYQEAIKAIENHDNKDTIISSGEYNILTLLSAADDLDAFGHIGIYRYLEIYHERKVLPRKAGVLIRKNAETRFLNFAILFCDFPELIEKHKSRYLKLDSFFGNFNHESAGYNFNGNEPSGFCGVMDIISRMAEFKIPLPEVLNNPHKFSKDPVTLRFLEILDEELKESVL